VKTIKEEVQLEHSGYSTLKIEYDIFGEYVIELQASDHSDIETKCFSLAPDDFTKFIDAVNRFSKLIVLA